ncbi:hypothetical protein DYGSA30_38510 [Dyella sp. GSA-30]|nr:hypothetical protein DYGSA30_38510 [Dyella sp. GSA-30]
MSGRRHGLATALSAPMLSAMPLTSFDNDPPPKPPVEPDAGDCCGEGCVPCIFDIYETALQRYRDELAQWQLRHPDAADDSPAQGAGNR